MGRRQPSRRRRGSAREGAIIRRATGRRPTVAHAATKRMIRLTVDEGVEAADCAIRGGSEGDGERRPSTRRTDPAREGPWPRGVHRQLRPARLRTARATHRARPVPCTGCRSRGTSASAATCARRAKPRRPAGSPAWKTRFSPPRRDRNSKNVLYRPEPIGQFRTVRGMNIHLRAIVPGGNLVRWWPCLTRFDRHVLVMAAKLAGEGARGEK